MKIKNAKIGNKVKYGVKWQNGVAEINNMALARRLLARPSYSLVEEEKHVEDVKIEDKVEVVENKNVEAVEDLDAKIMAELDAEIIEKPKKKTTKKKSK